MPIVQSNKNKNITKESQFDLETLIMIMQVWTVSSPSGKRKHIAVRKQCYLFVHNKETDAGFLFQSLCQDKRGNVVCLMLRSRHCRRSDVPCWNFWLVTSKCSRCKLPKVTKKLYWLWQNLASAHTTALSARLPPYVIKEPEEENDTWGNRCHYVFYFMAR